MDEYLKKHVKKCQNKTCSTLMFELIMATCIHIVKRFFLKSLV